MRSGDGYLPQMTDDDATTCPGCGQPRDADPSATCTNPACPTHDEPEVAANEPSGGHDIGA